MVALGKSEGKSHKNGVMACENSVGNESYKDILPDRKKQTKKKKKKSIKSQELNMLET